MILPSKSDVNGRLELSDDGKEVIEEALSLTSSAEAGDCRVSEVRFLRRVQCHLPRANPRVSAFLSCRVCCRCA
jgi:hypothetical protein